MSKVSRRSVLASALVALSSATWLAMAVDWFRGVCPFCARQGRARTRSNATRPSRSSCRPATRGIPSKRRSGPSSLKTTRAIRMRPDDDMRLGRLLKEAGFRQDVAYGTGSVSVEWHRHDVGALQRPGADSREKLLDLCVPR